MSKRICGVLSLVFVFLAAEAFPVQAQSADAKALLEEAARAMGGMKALRSLKNQVVESEGKQFEHASPQRPLGPSKQVSRFRYTLDARPDPATAAARLGWPNLISTGRIPPIRRGYRRLRRAS